MNKKEFTVETFNEMLDKVVFWNSLGGNDVEDKSLIPMYLTLSREEMFGPNEFLQGWFNDDKVMQADGVADLIFTVGFLSQLKKERKLILDDEDLCPLSTGEVIYYLAGELIEEIYYTCLYDSLYGLCYKISEYIDVEAVFNAVYESNMSKYVDIKTIGDLEWFIHEEIGDIESQGRYAEIVTRKQGDYIILLANKDVREGKVFDKPKVVKTSRFFEPKNLEQFIY